MAGLDGDDTSSTVYIDDLNPLNPDGADAKSQGDNHIRFVKRVLKNTFPAVSGIVTANHSELNYLDGITSRSLVIADSSNDKGYATLPGGLILQWGFQTSVGTSAGNASVAFPLEFPTACLAMWASISGTGQYETTYTVQVGASTTTYLDMTAQANGVRAANIGVRWFAIGY